MNIKIGSMLGISKKHYPCSVDVYLISNKLEVFRNSGKFILKINWLPLETDRDVWRQIINPVTNPSMSPNRPVEDYIPIGIQYTNNLWDRLEWYESSLPSYNPNITQAQLWAR